MMSEVKEYEARTGRSAFFRIHKNDAGTEAYEDHYVHDLQAAIERLRFERDEAREAARELAEYRPVLLADRLNWIERFPWLVSEGGE